MVAIHRHLARAALRRLTYPVEQGHLDPSSSIFCISTGDFETKSLPEFGLILKLKPIRRAQAAPGTGYVENVVLTVVSVAKSTLFWVFAFSCLYYLPA